MSSKHRPIIAVGVTLVAAITILGTTAIAGSLEPPAAPAPTMRTLEQLTPAWAKTISSGSDRFVVLSDFGGAAVLDLETGLVWELVPSSTLYTWAGGCEACNRKKVGERFGWRLPTVEELSSLVDDTGLPAGNPFTTVAYLYFWSITTMATNSAEAATVSVNLGAVSYDSKVNQSSPIWCVRSSL